MRKGKYAKSGVATKALILTLSLVLMISATIGGTLAWLMDTDTAVTNTFTESDIDIELNETGTTLNANNKVDEKSFQMIPGFTIDKDPKVTVKAGSEDCYVFVDVDESDNLDDFITYAMDDGWTQLTEDEEGKNISDKLVFYRTQTGLTAEDAQDQTYDVIGNKGADGNKGFVANKILVKETVNKQMMDALTEETYPTLTFKAYAVQLYKSNGVEFGAAEAWAKAQTLNTGSGT